ncbi:unnamed protein product [Paramecium primaurelia]|uniref:Uncharacterized protein n=1 Tax=Paramecium primaurelia TaxID=5886 RepID=A0A8S1NYQ0_PARPR|nr:unnamed protein product [Paramecium primaurelia]
MEIILFQAFFNQQLRRFKKEYKYNQNHFTQMQLLLIANDLQYERYYIGLKQSEIRNELFRLSEKERLLREKGYQDRFRLAWKKCQCGNDWTFMHLTLYDSKLNEEFEKFEEELESYLLSGSQIYLMQFYQDYMCEKIQILNEKFYELIQKNYKPSEEMEIE